MILLSYIKFCCTILLKVGEIMDSKIKRIISMLLVTATCFSIWTVSSVEAFATSDTVSLGDVNQDGKLSEEDASLKKTVNFLMFAKITSRAAL